ncbi:MAG: hypothetical protein IT184_11235 [Acidobacteria bacterium]|nr:hypothetical protein [Acidobacteriota bacterium]
MPREPRRLVVRWWRPIAVLVAALAGLAGTAGAHRSGVGDRTRIARADAPAVQQATRAEARSRLPARLTDQQFWTLSTELSEPNGFFRSENLVSNEHTYQYVIPALQRLVPRGGVYLGVAPDQNFTYIVATEPRMAFIVDIRRGNLLEHLMYKAIIELSADRADFLALLFSKPRPPGIAASASVDALFAAFAPVATSEDLYRQNARRIRDVLLRKHGLPLSATDLDQLESIYFAFFWDGPGLRYSTGPSFGWRGRGGPGNFPTYQDLMVVTDWEGRPRSYLASEANYRFLRGLQERNLVVPVVGNFAGPKALRGVGRYLRQRGATVSAFYVSNVEQYLFQDGLFDDFAHNVASLPLDESSTFIRSVSARFGYAGEMLGPDGRASALDPIKAFVRDATAGRITSYFSLNERSR